MVYSLMLTEMADRDTEEALFYYGGINPSLSDRFYNELLDIYEKLSNSPQYFSFIPSITPNTIRDVKLPSFPYVVVYEIQGKSVSIIAVMNCYKKPLVL